MTVNEAVAVGSSVGVKLEVGVIVGDDVPDGVRVGVKVGNRVGTLVIEVAEGTKTSATVEVGVGLEITRSFT